MQNSKKQTAGSFGRALVPFFLEGKETLVENEKHVLPENVKKLQSELHIPQNAKIEVRKFTDGYFEMINLPLDSIKMDSNLKSVTKDGKSTPIKPTKGKQQDLKTVSEPPRMMPSYRFED